MSVLGKFPVNTTLFGAAARYIGSTWAANQARERVASRSRGRRSLRERLQSLPVKAGLNAAAYDIVVTERFMRVFNFIDPLSRLQDPALIPRIVVANLRALFAHNRNSLTDNRKGEAHAGYIRPARQSI